MIIRLSAGTGSAPGGERLVAWAADIGSKELDNDGTPRTSGGASKLLIRIGGGKGGIGDIRAGVVVGRKMRTTRLSQDEGLAVPAARP